jgi:hypothetical protein
MIILFDLENLIQNRREDNVKAIKLSKLVLRSYNFEQKIKTLSILMLKPILHYY